MLIKANKFNLILNLISDLNKTILRLSSQDLGEGHYYVFISHLQTVAARHSKCLN
jgi:hypothetical protein